MQSSDGNELSCPCHTTVLILYTISRVDNPIHGCLDNSTPPLCLPLDSETETVFPLKVKLVFAESKDEEVETDDCL